MLLHPKLYLISFEALALSAEDRLHKYRCSVPKNSQLLKIIVVPRPGFQTVARYVRCCKARREASSWNYDLWLKLKHITRSKPVGFLQASFNAWLSTTGPRAALIRIWSRRKFFQYLLMNQVMRWNSPVLAFGRRKVITSDCSSSSRFR